MPISEERFADRIEFLRAFLALKSAIHHVASATDAYKDADVIESLNALNDMMEKMIGKLEKENE